MCRPVHLLVEVGVSGGSDVGEGSLQGNNCVGKHPFIRIKQTVENGGNQ